MTTNAGPAEDRPDQTPQRPRRISRANTILIAAGVLVMVFFGLAFFGLLGMGFLISNSKSTVANPEPSPKPNVILISIDTLRADVLGTYGGAAKTPFIDSLAADGALFEHCYTPNPLTLPAHASMLSGTSPIYHQVRDNTYQQVPAENLVLLQEEYSRNGYRTGGFVSSRVLAKGCGIERGFDDFDSDIAKATSETTLDERNAEDTLAKASAWILGGAQASFTFVHLIDPHFPYWPPNAEARGLKPSRELTREAVLPLYLAEVEYVDAQLKRFFERLEAAGKLENTLVILTADHGEDLGERGELTHGYTIYDGTTHVPLILWGAGIKKARIADPVSLNDIFSGAADLSGLELSTEAKAQQQGISLKRSLGGGASKGRQIYLESHYGYLQSGWARLRGIRDAQHLIVIHDSYPEVYASGAGDAPNLYAAGDADAKAAYLQAYQLVGERLNAWFPTGEARPRSAPRQGQDYQYHYHYGISPQAAENLGYPVNALGAPSFEKESLSDSAGLPSPDARIEEIGKMQQAYLAFSGGRYASALGVLEPIVNPASGASTAGMQALKLYARVALESANQAHQEGRHPAARRDAEAALAALTRGEAAAREVKLDLASLEMAEAGLLLELRLAKDGETLTALATKAEKLLERVKATGNQGLLLRAKKLEILARYVLAHVVATSDEDKLLIVSELFVLDPKDPRLPAMRKGESVIAAFP